MVGVMDGVLYGAAIVQQWLAKQCVRNNSWSNSSAACSSGCYQCVRWCVEPCVAQCRYAGRRVVLSRDTQLDGCIRDKAKRCETLTEDDTMYHAAAGVRANVTQRGNEIGRGSVQASRAR